MPLRLEPPAAARHQIAPHLERGKDAWCCVPLSLVFLRQLKFAVFFTKNCHFQWRMKRRPLAESGVGFTFSAGCSRPLRAA